MSRISIVLDKLPPESSETLHDGVKRFLQIPESRITQALFRHLLGIKPIIGEDRLSVTFGNEYTSKVELPNCVHVGAGWDKNGKCVRSLLEIIQAGSAEVGTTTYYAQPGNPRPRAYGIPDGVVFNRYGFNSEGALKIFEILSAYSPEIINRIGISLGINKEIPHSSAAYFYALVAEKLVDCGSYFVINVSSPNTPGLRNLQQKDYLTEIILAVREKLSNGILEKPLFLKISPDLSFSELDEILDVAITNKCTGVIATNTTVNPDIKGEYGERWRNEPGGLSGNNLSFRNLSTNSVRHIYQKAGKELQIIGVGGIHNTLTALEKITAGANAIQIVTGFRQEGLTVINQIELGLIRIMDLNNISHISQLRGVKMSDLNLG